MTHWLDVFRYELQQAFRRKAYLFLTFGVPLLAIAAFYGYQFYQDRTSSESEEVPSTPVAETVDGDELIGYVDRTPEALFPPPESYPEVSCNPEEDELNALSGGENIAGVRSNLIKRISSPYCLRSRIIAFDALETGKAALDAGTIDLLAVIEPDYVATGSVSIYIESLNISAMERQSSIEDYIIRSVLYNVDAEEYEALYLRLRNPAYVTIHKLTETGEVETENENRNFVLVYGFGLVTMFGIFWGGGYLMQSVVQEKESRIIEIIMSSVQPTALLAGKVLAMGLTALLQIMLLVATFTYLGAQAGDVFSQVGNLDISARMLAFVGLYFVLGFLQFGSLMAAIGAISTTVREAQNFVVVVTLPAAIPFFFLTLFVEDPNGTLPRILSLFPLTAPLSMIMRMAVTNVPAIEVAISLGLLLLGISGAIWFAGRLFRVNILLSGTMPSFKDIPKLLRG